MAMFIAACGSYTTNGSGGYGSGGTNPPATTPTTGGSSSSSVIHTATTTVKDQSETMLTNAKGMTLYYFTADLRWVSASWPYVPGRRTYFPTGHRLC